MDVFAYLAIFLVGIASGVITYKVNEYRRYQKKLSADRDHSIDALVYNWDNNNFVWKSDIVSLTARIKILEDRMNLK